MRTAPLNVSFGDTGIAGARFSQHLVRALRGLVVLGLLVAVALKLATPHESGMVLAKATKELGLELPTLHSHLVASVLLDLLLAACAFSRGGPLRAMFLVLLGSAFSLVHALAYLQGKAGGCGCFGAWIDVPRWVSLIVAMSMAALGWLDLFGTIAHGLRLRACLQAVTLGLAGVVASVWLVPEVEQRWARTVVLESDSIRARDRFVYVFSPRCPECVTSGRRLRSLAKSGRLVGVTTPSMGDPSEFFAQIGFSFPVEFLTAKAWFALLYPAPPGYYRVDPEGKLERVPSEVMFSERPR
jgi:hypothetical protein